jgi:hypothetical protein
VRSNFTGTGDIPALANLEIVDTIGDQVQSSKVARARARNV